MSPHSRASTIGVLSIIWCSIVAQSQINFSGAHQHHLATLTSRDANVALTDPAL